jgi:hypothetical protein
MIVPGVRSMPLACQAINRPINPGVGDDDLGRTILIAIPSVALRLAFDHPARVERLAYLGAIPIGETLARCTTEFATAWWHWFSFARLF